MVNSHAGMLVPGSNESMCANARSNVSCTKSSARSILPHSEIANARRLGTVVSTWSRMPGSSFMRTIPLRVSILFADAANHVLKMLRYTLVDVRVVHRPQLLPDSNLSLAPQPDFVLVGTLTHGIMRLWPVRNRLDSLEICLTAFH